MWIFLSVLATIIALITLILLLPISLKIGLDKDKEFTLLLKVPFKTFDLTKEDEDTENSGKFKEFLGLEKSDKKDTKSGEFLEKIRDKISLISRILKRLFELLGKCTVRALKINIVCAENDAATTAINYGICYAVISPLINFLHATMKVKRRGEKINIYSDFEGRESSFDFEIILTASLFRVAAAALMFIFDESKRKINEKEKA